MKKLWLIALLTISLWSAGCTSNASRKAPEKAAALAPVSAASSNVVVIPPDSPKLKQIRVAAVQEANLSPGEVLAPGKIDVNPNRVSRVPLPVTGRIAQVLVKLGDTVAAGQPLLTIESQEASAALTTLTQSEASVTQANAALRQTNAELAKARSAQSKAQADYERTQELFEHDAVAKKETLNAENELRLAKATVETAQAAVEQAQAGIEQAKAAREQVRRQLALLGVKPENARPLVTVRAPLVGKVLEINLVAGEFRSDTAAPVLTIADLRSVWVVSEIAERDIHLITAGEAVDITLDAYPNQNFPGRVARLSDTLDPKTRTIKVMIELNNPGGRFRPEMFGRIRHLEPPRPTPALPVGAVLQDGSRSLVYVEQSAGRFELRAVTLGNRANELVAITSGISAGERVVVDGAILLKQ